MLWTDCNCRDTIVENNRREGKGKASPWISSLSYAALNINRPPTLLQQSHDRPAAIRISCCFSEKDSGLAIETVTESSFSSRPAPTSSVVVLPAHCVLQELWSSSSTCSSSGPNLTCRSNSLTKWWQLLCLTLYLPRWRLRIHD